MSLASSAFCENLRAFDACLRAWRIRTDCMGVCTPIVRNTHASARRDQDVHAEFWQLSIPTWRKVYVNDPLRGELATTVCRLESKALCLQLRPPQGEPWRSGKAPAVLLVLPIMRGNSQPFAHIRGDKVHNVNIIDQLIPEAGASQVVNRVCIDHGRLVRRASAGSPFATLVNGMAFKGLARDSIAREAAVANDYTVRVIAVYSRLDCQKPPLSDRSTDPESDEASMFIKG